MAFSIPSALSALPHKSVALAVLAGAGANVAAAIATKVVLLKPLLGIEKEMGGPPFRPLSDPRMGYFPFGSSIVGAALFTILAFATYGQAAVRAWTPAETASYGVGVWALTSAHGIFLDYTTYPLSGRMLLFFWLGNLVETYAMTYAIGCML